MNTTVPMALVKFSVEMAIASAAWFTPSDASHEKVKFADACKMPATSSAREGGIARLVEADVEPEGPGHHAGERVGKLVEHDEEQDQKRVALPEEVGEGRI